MNRAVHGAVDAAVDDAVWRAVAETLYGAVHRPSQHPNIDRLIGEIRQTRARWGAA